MVDDRTYDFPSNSYYRDPQDYGRDYGSGQDYTYSSARRYLAAGRIDRRRDDRDSRNSGGQPGDSRPYYGSYAHDGHRFDEVGRDPNRDYHDDRGDGRSNHRHRPDGYHYRDRGFIARAGDELRSWFGDGEAERRREFDQRFDERHYGMTYGRVWAGIDSDGDYHNWRRDQIDALDRDYQEYRSESARKFEEDFAIWRAQRQAQRDALERVAEQMVVTGSDGGHVGTVDAVRGDQIILTRSDGDGGGRSPTISSRWIDTVDDKVTITRTADEMKQHWRDDDRAGEIAPDRPIDLNQSFPGTY
jgi:hypothetical protein